MSLFCTAASYDSSLILFDVTYSTKSFYISASPSIPYSFIPSSIYSPIMYPFLAHMCNFCPFILCVPVSHHSWTTLSFVAYFSLSSFPSLLIELFPLYRLETLHCGFLSRRLWSGPRRSWFCRGSCRGGEVPMRCWAALSPFCSVMVSGLLPAMGVVVARSLEWWGNDKVSDRPWWTTPSLLLLRGGGEERKDCL